MARHWTALLVLAICFSVGLEQDEDIPHNEVKNWALKFGEELWEFGKQLTKMDEIKRKYKNHDVEVIRKDGLLLIREMAQEVKNMMDIKMNAVLRLMDSAEAAAQSHKFDDKISVNYYNSKKLNEYSSDGKLLKDYQEITLTPNSHFDKLKVNTSFSSVLLPPDIKDADAKVKNAIKWSGLLDSVFQYNYEWDPSLSWQYFGSATGFVRQYPAIKWPQNDKKQELYDFRTSSWYIEAATSPKDVVVLVDSSGSMTGPRKDIARAVVNNILDTLGNNDFVNVYKFSDVTEELVPCFKDSMVQANVENIRELKNALNTLKPENIANFSSALITAFGLLHQYNRTSQGSQCNQAIMLITDGPPSKFEDIFKQHNMPHLPVRVFTYLVGRDGTNANEMRWMACNNKGYYVQVNSQSEAREAVLNYIYVMARPMVMYLSDHPIQWTPVYADIRGLHSKSAYDPDYQLMTSVSTPIFDRRNFTEEGERVAELLGVIGTDVPILQLKKLVPPYKLGVNGYSFIINNNGHILYHPDLRPLISKSQGRFQESLKPNYNSVDLTEVELVDSDGGPRENNTLLLHLRHDMIDQKEGEAELNVKVHCDDMKRVVTRRHKYFFHQIDGTPFSLGIAIPDIYGHYEARKELEIKQTDADVTEYFKGKNWKVHPDWVYCEYNYESEHNFASPEEQILHFIGRTQKPGWKWMSQRPRAQTMLNNEKKKMDKDSYFCDKSLLQSLVFDAYMTEGLDKNATGPLKENKHQGYQMFGQTLTFVATRSGLLRWQDHPGPGGLKKTQAPHFSTFNGRAIDEVWYKRAVEQHSVDSQSFVFSVDFNVGAKDNTLVTATHAIFLDHNGYQAPIGVVGIQFQHSALFSHFVNKTYACTDQFGCKKTCASDELDCYVLDNNGFIILSENSDHTGKFFGEIDGTIMDSLVQDRIYKKVQVFDYQGACVDDKSPYSDSGFMLTPLHQIQWLFHWILGKIAWIMIHTNLYQLWDPDWSYAEEDDGEMYSEDYEKTQYVVPEEVNTVTSTEPPPINKSQLRPCDKRVDLYILQPDRLNTSGTFNPLKGKLTNCHVTGCERPFSVQKIPHSNLILLVVDTLCPCGSKQLSIIPQEVVYNSSTQCQKPRESMYRRRPPKCMNYHPEEIQIKQCAHCSTIKGSTWLLVFSISLWLFNGAQFS